jgi:hypothetical protein
VNEIEDHEIAKLVADLLRASDYIIEARHQLKPDTVPKHSRASFLPRIVSQFSPAA